MQPSCSELCQVLKTRDPRCLFECASRAAGLVLRKNTWDFPQTCALVCRFISCLDENHYFGAFVILENVLSAPHKDGKNAHSPYMVVAISHFKGGQIWHEDASGEVQRVVHDNLLTGRLLSLQDGPVKVFARQFSSDRALVRAAHSADCIPAHLGEGSLFALARLGVQISRASVGGGCMARPGLCPTR